MRREALARARISRGVYRCEECGEKASKLDVDHIVQVTPETGITSPKDWGIYAQRLLYKDSSSMAHITVDQLKSLCKPCHLAKTKRERSKRKGRS
jgi:5-methylcytosine-specific restriction endonuclease McrA